LSLRRERFPPQGEGRVPVGHHDVGVRHHPVLPAENSHHEVEQPPRVPAGEQDREPGEDDGEDYGCLLQQKYLPFETPEEAAEMVAEIMARPSLAEEYP
jgi:hypothetical protein